MIFAESSSNGSSGSAWLPLVSVLLGFLSSQILEWLKDKRAAIREAKVREATSKAARIDRLNDFQTKTLLDFQEQIDNWANSVGQIYQLPSSHPSYIAKYDQSLALLSRTIILNSRVRDERLRELYKKMRNEIAEAMSDQNSAEEKDDWMQRSQQTSELMNDRVGVLLREMDF